MNYFKRDYLLFQKWTLFSALITFFVWYINFNGWLKTLIIADISYITPAIMVLIVLGIILSGIWALIISKELSNVKRGNFSFVLKKFYNNPEKLNLNDSKNLESLKLLLSSRVLIIRHIAWALVLMGLIGTILGFVLVLLSIDPSLIGNIDMLSTTMSEITKGLGVALYTTLAGSVGNLILMVNFNMIQTSTIQLYSYIITNHEAIGE